jgi:NADH dehydrogenase FAD-containing subunit
MVCVCSSVQRAALALPTKRRLLVVGSGRSSTAFLRRIDPALFENHGGRVELVVASPKDLREFSNGEDVREIVLERGGYFVRARANGVNIFDKRVEFESSVTGEEFDVAYDSLVLGIGTKTDFVEGTEGRAFRLPRDEARLKKHLEKCRYFYDVSGDIKYLQIAVVVPPSGESDLGFEIAKVSTFLDREFEKSEFYVSEGMTDAVRVHESFVVERPDPDGGRRFNRYGTIVTTDLERRRTDLAWNLVEQIPLVDANYHAEKGILVDGFQRVVGAGGDVFAIGSAAFERSEESRAGATSSDVSAAHGNRLADLVNGGVLSI